MIVSKPVIFITYFLCVAFWYSSMHDGSLVLIYSSTRIAIVNDVEYDNLLSFIRDTTFMALMLSVWDSHCEWFRLVRDFFLLFALFKKTFLSNILFWCLILLIFFNVCLPCYKTFFIRLTTKSIFINEKFCLWNANCFLSHFFISSKICLKISNFSYLKKKSLVYLIHIIFWVINGYIFFLTFHDSWIIKLVTRHVNYYFKKNLLIMKDTHDNNWHSINLY